MKVKCKDCEQNIPSQNVNVKEDTFYCGSCGSLGKLSSIMKKHPPLDSSTYAEGVKTSSSGDDWSISIEHLGGRSIFFALFTIVWTFISVMYAMEGNVSSILFLAVSLYLIYTSLMSIFGETLISYIDGKALYSRKFFGIGTSKTFDWAGIDTIESQYHPKRGKYIILSGSSHFEIGPGINTERLHFSMNFLKSKLI